MYSIEITKSSSDYFKVGKKYGKLKKEGETYVPKGEKSNLEDGIYMTKLDSIPNNKYSVCITDFEMKDDRIILDASFRKEGVQESNFETNYEDEIVKKRKYKIILDEYTWYDIMDDNNLKTDWTQQEFTDYLKSHMESGMELDVSISEGTAYRLLIYRPSDEY